MANKYIRQADTSAWIIQVWASFLLATSCTAIGIIYLPVDNWIKSFIGMGLIFSVGSSFTLAKTIRDNHESQRIVARIDEAKVEKILAEHHPFDK